MRFAALPETVDVLLDAVGRHFQGIAPLDEQFGVVHALRAGRDLLAAHEDVLAVAEWHLPVILGQRCVTGGHGLEGSHFQRVFFDALEVCLVFCQHYFPQHFFLRGGEIFLVLGFTVARFDQHVDGFFLR